MLHVFHRFIGAAFAFGLTAASAWAQTPFSDNFTGNILNPGWTVSSPNPSSSVAFNGHGDLDITASPLNGGSDLYSGSNDNAPIILQRVASTLNWTITTEVTFAPTNNYQGAGILLAYQPGGFASSSQFNRIEEHALYPNDGGDMLEFGSGTETLDSVPYTAKTVYFRVTKSGDAKKGWSYSGYSTAGGGKPWTKFGTFTTSTPYTWIGLFTIRQPWDGNDSVISLASFNYFNVKVSP